MPYEAINVRIFRLIPYLISLLYGNIYIRAGDNCNKYTIKTKISYVKLIKLNFIPGELK